MTETAKGARLLLAGIALGGLAFWAGAHWGHPGPLVATAQPDLPPAASSAPLTSEEQVNIRIYKQASPAVANIITRTVEYDFFFNAVPVEGAGSGFVIDPKGYILTNYHVVADAEKIEVLLGDQRAQTRYAAKFIGADQRNDVALLKIDPKGAQLAALPLGDSSALQVGQKVLAIGNPFGFQSTLTTGVVSALGRTVQTGQNTFIEDAIQTDASINRGNSGGPLLDTRGQVIGINSAIYSPTGTAAGVGFAIPINLAKRIANDLITEGRVRRAVLGLEGTPLFEDLANYLKFPVKQGLLIERVDAGGPAARAGLRGGTEPVTDGLRRYMTGGDLIVSADGKPVVSQLDLNLALNRKRPGDTITLEIYRGQQKMVVKVTLGEA
ncbi:MAG TPA: trypsin-like peptidase domain-containing protein [Candidatus Acidoferrales bacterium]|nr:trypsin-like peptidase domain-containing protein [Candidatus Acidoferrales bacterium]